MARKRKIKIETEEELKNENVEEETDYINDEALEEDFDENLDDMDLYDSEPDITSVFEKKDKKAPPEESKNLTGEELLKKELEESKKVASQNWENFLRARADYENFKKRSEQQIASSGIRGKRAIIEKLLDVIDNFERALNVDESKADVKSLLIGIRMIYKQLSGILEEEGLKNIPTVGSIFDPRLHEALDSIISDQYNDEEIIQEYLKGYTFKDEIIRPAKVKVSRASSPPQEGSIDVKV